MISVLEFGKPSNIKPGSWYKEYIAKYDELIYSNDKDLIEKYEPDLETRVETLKESDRDVDCYNHLHKYYNPFFGIENRLYSEIYSKYNPNPKLQKKLERIQKLLYQKIPIGITKEQVHSYHALGDSCYSDSGILFEANSFQENKKLISELKERIIALKEFPDINQIYSYKPCGWERCVLFDFFLLDHCLNAVKQEYLVTYQLYRLWDNLANYEYDIYYDEMQHPDSIEDLDFRDFSYENDEIFELIRKNENWHDIERDLSLYQEKKRGKYLDELSQNFGMKITAISMAVKKVRGAFNYWKGKIFEDFVEKRLKESKLCNKVIKEAGKGQADILAYSNDDKELYIFSLKNIKINRKPYWLTKEELRPELERALLQKLDYKVHLILLVFDNYHNKAKQFEINYDNSKNIDISK